MSVKTKSSSQQFNWANHTTQSTNYSYTTPTLRYITPTPRIHVETMQKHPPLLFNCNALIAIEQAEKDKEIKGER
jgi:hypothetical protein